jgi:hypothetical protein
MSKDAIHHYVDPFLRAVYPDMPELAAASKTEEACLKDATELITTQRQRIAALEAEVKTAKTDGRREWVKVCKDEMIQHVTDLGIEVSGEVRENDLTGYTLLWMLLKSKWKALEAENAALGKSYRELLDELESAHHCLDEAGATKYDGAMGDELSLNPRIRNLSEKNAHLREVIIAYANKDAIDQQERDALLQELRVAGKALKAVPSHGDMVRYGSSWNAYREWFYGKREEVLVQPHMARVMSEGK